MCGFRALVGADRELEGVGRVGHYPTFATEQFANR